MSGLAQSFLILSHLGWMHPVSSLLRAKKLGQQ